MPCQLARLLEVIEGLRCHLNQVAVNKNLTDPEVVGISQRLDQLLNEYNAYMLNLTAIPA